MAEQIITKTCRTCKQTKTISEFYKNNQREDGYTTQCKICISKHRKIWKQTPKGSKSIKRALQKHRKTEKYRIQQKRYQEGEKYKATCKLYRNSEAGKVTQEKYRKANLAKYNAKAAVERAIKSGKLPHPDSLQCFYCPKQAKQYHHHKGYAPEHQLDIVPACIPCHGKARKIS